MNLKKSFGQRLKTLRRQKGYSQEKFSEMINVAQNTLSNIENGIHFCSADTIERISTALNTSPQDLFNFGAKEPHAKQIDDISEILIKNPERIDDIWRIIRALTIK